MEPSRAQAAIPFHELGILDCGLSPTIDQDGFVPTIQIVSAQAQTPSGRVVVVGIGPGYRNHQEILDQMLVRFGCPGFLDIGGVKGTYNTEAQTIELSELHSPRFGRGIEERIRDAVVKEVSAKVTEFVAGKS